MVDAEHAAPWSVHRLGLILQLGWGAATRGRRGACGKGGKGVGGGILGIVRTEV